MTKSSRAAALMLLVAAPAAEAASVTETGFGVTHRFGFFTSPFVVEEESDDGAATAIAEETSLPRPNLLRTGAVRGSIATGEVGARTTTTPTVDPRLVKVTNIFAEVDIFDTLTFDLTSRPAGEVVDVNIAISIEGVFTPFLSPRGDEAFFDFSLTSEDDELRAANINYFANTFAIPQPFEIGDTVAVGDPPSVSLGFGGGFIGDWTHTLGDAARGELSGVFSLIGGKTTEVSFSMGLLTSGNADFFNTATLDFQTDADFTSASGVFMGAGVAGPVTPVPLPASALFLPVALAGFGLFRRKRAG